jgi:hypothetical protein
MTKMKPVPFNPSLPDVTKRSPKRAFSATNMLLLFLEDVPSIGGVGLINYRFVLVAGSLPDRVPVCYVTLESSPFATNQLCAFDREGGHANYATLTSDNLEAAFLEAAFDIVREKVGALDQLTELRGTTSSSSGATTARYGLSRKTICVLFIAYFVAEFCVSLIKEANRPSFNGIDAAAIAGVLGGATVGYLVSGALPILGWAFARFKSQYALLLFVAWATLAVVEIYVEELGYRANNRETQVREVPTPSWNPSERRESPAPPKQPTVIEISRLKQPTLLESSLRSRWALETPTNCDVPIKTYSLKFDNGKIIWRTGSNKIDIESIVLSLKKEFRTITINSMGRIKPGTTWFYYTGGPDRIWVEEEGQSPFLLARCPK